MKRSLILTALSFLVLAQLALAQVPQTMNYQGVLKQGGEIIADGSYSLTFRLWDADAGGNNPWSEVRTVQTTNGLFSVNLGENTPITVDFKQQYWLEIVVGAESMGRVPLTAVPYSLNSQGVSGSSNVFPGAGNVGIGTATPENALHVKGWFKLEGSDFIMVEPTKGNGGRALVHSGTDSNDDLLILNHWGDFEKGVSVEGPQLVVTGNLVVNDSVGIGTDVPVEVLDVTGSIRVSNGVYSSGELLLNSNTAWDLKLNDGNPGNVLMANGGGNVGIGTAGPGGNLHINDDEYTYASLIFSHKGTGMSGAFGAEVSMLDDDFRLVNKEPASLHLGTDNSYDLSIISGGNVGIGTAAPTAKLEVAGNASVDGNLTTTGDATVLGNLAVLGTITQGSQTEYYSFGVRDATSGGTGGSNNYVEAWYDTMMTMGYPYNLTIPLHLPHGATITGITINVDDDAGAADAMCKLYSMAITDFTTSESSLTPHADFSATGTGPHSANSPALNYSVDNQTERFWLRITSGEPTMEGAYIRFFGGYITYTVN